MKHDKNNHNTRTATYFNPLPANFIGKQIEVIAYPINEVIDRQEITDKPLTYFASEQSLAKDWLSQEEDNAWKNL